MSRRLQPLPKASLSSEQMGLYRSLVSGPRGVGIVQADTSLFGPFDAMLRNPAVGERLQSLGLEVQSSSVLAASTREAIILSVVAARGCAPEWDAHVPRALAAGLTERDVAAIADRAELPARSRELSTALEVTRALLDHVPVDDDLFARAGGAVGERGLFDISALVSYYDGLCTLFALFRLEED